MNRDKNIAVFKDTLEKSETLYKYTGIVDNLTTKPNLDDYAITPESNIMPKIHITNDDCIALIDTDRHGVIIDSASLKNPGGGVRNGSNAQEENLCRQSNLYKAIEQLQFPLHNKTNGVYIPHVTFFKNGSEYKYAPMETTKAIDVMMLFSRPRSVFKSDAESYEYHTGVFKSLIAFSNKYDVEYIILPCIGSGVFGNKPETIAKALKDTLSMYKLTTVKNIYVACFNNHPNYEAYTTVFQN